MSAIGQYRHRVTLEAPGPPVPDPSGGYTEAYTPLDPPAWDCAIEIAGARDLELVTGGAVVTESTHLLRGRYHPGIGPTTRIHFGARVFEVQFSRDRDQRQIELLVLARELLPAEAGPTRTAATASSSAPVAAGASSAPGGPYAGGSAD